MKKKKKVLKVYIKMEKTIINFGDSEIEKQKFHHYNSPILINNIDISEILVSVKVFLVKRVLRWLVWLN